MKWNNIKDWLFIIAALANIGTFILGFNTGKKRGIEITQNQQQNKNGSKQSQQQKIKF